MGDVEQIESRNTRRMSWADADGSKPLEDVRSTVNRFGMPIADDGEDSGAHANDNIARHSGMSATSGTSSRSTERTSRGFNSNWSAASSNCSRKVAMSIDRDRSVVFQSIRASPRNMDMLEEIDFDFNDLGGDAVAAAEMEVVGSLFSPDAVDADGLTPLEVLTHGRTAQEMLRTLPMIKCALEQGCTFDDVEGLNHAFLMFCVTRPLFANNQVAARELCDIFIRSGANLSDVKVSDQELVLVVGGWGHDHAVFEGLFRSPKVIQSDLVSVQRMVQLEQGLKKNLANIIFGLLARCEF